MPVNRSFKPLVRTSRRRCLPPFARDGRPDPVLGIPLLTLPDRSRQTLMERARLLVADPGYPPPSVVHAVADLMARHVQV
jgi:hypothetical protein